MNKNTIDVLSELIKSTQDDDIRLALFNLVHYTGGINSLGIKTIFDTPSTLENQVGGEQKEKSVQDLRVRWITFHNFRSVPFSKGQDKPYGVSFIGQGNQPSSLFLVGRNGTGKTTLYSALEHYYLSENSLSKNMSLNSRHILTYGFEQIERKELDVTSITVATTDIVSQVNTLDEHQPLCSPAPFCSEYDLIQIGKTGLDLFDYLLSQLGYDEIKKLLDKIQSIIDELDEKLSHRTKKETADLDGDDYNQIVLNFLKYRTNSKSLYPKEYTSTLFDRHLDAFNKGGTPKLFTSYWELLRQRSKLVNTQQTPLEQYLDGKATPSDSANIMTKKIRTMYERLETDLRLLVDVGRDDVDAKTTKVLNALYEEKESLKEDETIGEITSEDRIQYEHQRNILIRVISLIIEQRQSVVKKFVDDHFEMMKDIMNIFSNNDGELQTPIVGKDSLKIEIKAKGIGNTVFTATPQEYYNSFRYKLYAVSFKVALAFMEMRIKKIRIPLVIDDVFNASDFENNIRLEQFVENIYKAYASMKFKEPLQLILLTHDEMVQSSFRKGSVNQPCICGRLFSYRYAKKMEDDGIKCHTGCDGANPYYNLYMIM